MDPRDAGPGEAREAAATGAVPAGVPLAQRGQKGAGLQVTPQTPKSQCQTRTLRATSPGYFFLVLTT